MLIHKDTQRKNRVGLYQLNVGEQKSSQQEQQKSTLGPVIKITMHREQTWKYGENNAN